MEQATAAEMARYLATGRRGQFFAKMAPGEWMGLDNTDGIPVMFQGSLRDILETFIPWNGETRQANDIPGVLGITRTPDSMIRFPLVEPVHSKRKSGIRRTIVRKEIE